MGRASGRSANSGSPSRFISVVRSDTSCCIDLQARAGSTGERFRCKRSLPVRWHGSAKGCGGRRRKFWAPFRRRSQGRLWSAEARGSATGSTLLVRVIGPSLAGKLRSALSANRNRTGCAYARGSARRCQLVPERPCWDDHARVRAVHLVPRYSFMRLVTRSSGEGLIRALTYLRASALSSKVPMN